MLRTQSGRSLVEEMLAVNMVCGRLTILFFLLVEVVLISAQTRLALTSTQTRSFPFYSYSFKGILTPTHNYTSVTMFNQPNFELNK